MQCMSSSVQCSTVYLYYKYTDRVRHPCHFAVLYCSCIRIYCVHNYTYGDIRMGAMQKCIFSVGCPGVLYTQTVDLLGEGLGGLLPRTQILGPWSPNAKSLVTFNSTTYFTRSVLHLFFFFFCLATKLYCRPSALVFC